MMHLVCAGSSFELRKARLLSPALRSGQLLLMDVRHRLEVYCLIFNRHLHLLILSMCVYVRPVLVWNLLFLVLHE